MTALDRNLDQLQLATREVRDEFGHIGDERFMKRFFHLLLMECCEYMTPADFRRSVIVAREQLRKPL